MSYVIGSYNIQKFNNTKSFDKLARIILAEKMDVVGIQEAFSKMAIDMLVNELNHQSKSIMTEWKGYFHEHPEGTDDSGESYAFIWNNKKVSLVEIENKENPRVIDRFVIKGIIGQRRLVRCPLLAIFTAAGHIDGSNFEIRLINTHVRQGKGYRDTSCPDSEEKMRMNELNVLIKHIIPYCEEISTGKNMPSYTFLLGDYNLCLDSGLGMKYKIEEIIEGERGRQQRYYKTVQKLPTSLKLPKKDESIREDEDKEDKEERLMGDDTDYYSQNYDHFTYNIGLEEELELHPQRVEAIDLAYDKEFEDKQGRLKEYRKRVSDHVPIKITIDILKRYTLLGYESNRRILP